MKPWSTVDMKIYSATHALRAPLVLRGNLFRRHQTRLWKAHLMVTGSLNEYEGNYNFMLYNGSLWLYQTLTISPSMLLSMEEPHCFLPQTMLNH